MQALCRQRVRHAGPAEPKPWGPPGLRCQCGARRGHAARALGSSSSSGPSSPASLSTTQPAELSQQQQQQDLKQQQQDLQPQPAASAAAAQPPPLPAPAPAPAVDYAPKDRRALWMAAIKPPMYSVGVVPVLVGAAAAFAQHGALPWGRVGCLLSGAICVIAWLNLSNDAFDAATGVDASKPESFVNLTGSVAGVLAAAMAALAAGLALLAAGVGGAGDARVPAMLGAAIACGYLYQGPPFRLSYKGLGEPLCFVAFGPLATTAFYLASSPAAAAAATTAATAAGAWAAAAAAGMGGTVAAAGGAAPLLAGVSPLVVLLAVLVGLTTSVILFCSHWHQIKGDRAAGKMSPLVRIGTAQACEVLRYAVAAPYAVAAAAALGGACSPALLLVMGSSLPAAQALLEYAEEHHRVPAKIAALKKYGVRWHIAVGVALTAGLVLGAAA